MGLFGNLKSKVAGVFGKAKSIFDPPSKPTNKPFRENEKAGIEVTGQAARRKKTLERRVKEGLSSEVYKNKKDLDIGDSPYRDDFLDGYPLGRFASSNVYAVVYDRTQNHLYVQFMGGKGKNRGGPGRWYQYRQVDILEAKTMYNAASKGVWTWDYLRVRGSQTASKKPFSKDVPPPAYLPLGHKRSNILQSP